MDDPATLQPFDKTNTHCKQIHRNTECKATSTTKIERTGLWGQGPWDQEEWLRGHCVGLLGGARWCTAATGGICELLLARDRFDQLFELNYHELRYFVFRLVEYGVDLVLGFQLFKYQCRVGSHVFTRSQCSIEKRDDSLINLIYHKKKHDYEPGF